MLSYLLRRVLLMSITVLAISVMAFVIIQLPPGDFGRSFQCNEPVSKLIGERLLLTVLI